LIVLEAIPKTGSGSELRKGHNSNRAWVQMTKTGVEKAKMILTCYGKLAEHLLAHVGPEDLKTHLAVTEIVARFSQIPFLDLREIVEQVLAQSKAGNP
jgi:hypothetical protein